MSKLIAKELIFLLICALIAVAYLGLGYLLAPEVPGESNVIAVTNVNEIVDSLAARNKAVERRNAFFTAWIRRGMIGGVGMVIAISIFRAYLSGREHRLSVESAKKSASISRPPIMSSQAAFYLIACVILLFVLVAAIVVAVSL